MDLFGDLPDPGGDTKTPKQENVSTQPANTDASGDVKFSPNHNPAQATAEKRKSLENDYDYDNTHDKKRKIENTQEKKYQKDDIFKLKGFIAERQGERVDMQDAHILIDDYLTSFESPHPSIRRLSLYCVFDGHGGVRASRFASQHLHNNLRLKFPKGDVSQVEKEIKKAFIEAFKKTDEDFLKEATKSKPSWKDGTTAVAVLAINNTLYIANLGDSKAVLCRHKESEKKHVGVSLTSDHNPSVYEERIRIQKAGGWVREGRVMGQLEVARSIGDGPYKNHGVTCIPDVKRCQLTNNDSFIIIACDGLWKSLTVDDSIQFVNGLLKDKSIEASGKKSGEAVRLETACSKLASSAVLKLSGDNVTVLIVSIQKPPLKS